MGFAFLDHPRPLAIAHRGGALEAEENTLPAFDRAVALGYSHVELDVHATADGVAVIHHDPTPERMTGEPRRLEDLTWSQVSRLRTPGGAAIARLDDLLARHPGLRVAIEAKARSAVAPLAEAVRRTGALHRVCVGAFDPACTREARRLLGSGLCWSPAHAGVARIWLAGWGLPLPGSGFQVLQVPLRFRGVPVVTSRFLRAAHARGIAVQVWTVNDPAEAEHLIDMGVDALMTDRPEWLRALLQARGLWPGPKSDG